MDWTDVFKDAIGAYGSIETAKANNPQNQWYQWGQPGYPGMQPGFGNFAQGMGGVSPVVLLIGAGVLAFVLLRD